MMIVDRFLLQLRLIGDRNLLQLEVSLWVANVLQGDPWKNGWIWWLNADKVDWQMLHGVMSTGYLPVVFTMQLPVSVKKTVRYRIQFHVPWQFTYDWNRSRRITDNQTGTSEDTHGYAEGVIMLADISSVDVIYAPYMYPATLIQCPRDFTLNIFSKS